jgi:DnaK suppressor protein
VAPPTKPKARARAPRQPSAKARQAELVELLQEHRRRLTQGVQQHLQRARDVDEQLQHEGTTGDGVSAGDDISLALAQIQAEMLRRIDAALARLAAGKYGNCAECGTAISSQRLRALPFAVRCIECEATREAATPRVVSTQGLTNLES